MLRHREDDGAGEVRPPASVGRVSPGALRRPAGALVGWVLAALASALLALWVGGGRDREIRRDSEPVVGRPNAVTAPRAYPPARPDEEQIRRAYDHVRSVYAERGFPGLVTFSGSCAESLRADPRVLDFCLAFDVYVGALASGRGDATGSAWRADAAVRDLALARAVLPPDADPAARLAGVRRLARQVSLPPEAVTPPIRKPVAAPAHRPRPAQHAQVRGLHHAKAHAPAPVRREPVEARCRLRSTPGERVVCSSPTLKAADRRLQAAYRHALAASANPRGLAREQASWRVTVNAAAPDRDAVARLYASRTRELQGQAPRKR